MRRWRFTPVLLALCACGAESETLQVLRGRVDFAGLPSTPVEVQALRDGELSAAAPLAADGSFAIALAPGEPVRMVLVGGDGDAVAWLVDEQEQPATVLVCTADDPLELGRVATRPGLCVSAGACRSARALREECLEVAAHACGRLEPEVSSCLETRLAACKAAKDRRDLCLASRPPEECERERYLASTCDGVDTCEELMLSYWARCGFPCDGLTSLVERVCPACSEPDAVQAEFAPPGSSPCEGAP